MGLTWSVISVEGAKAALEFTRRYPPEERWPMIERLNEKLREGILRKGMQVTSPAAKERMSGILTFHTPQASLVAKRLEEEHIVVAPRVNTIRVSPHFYNTEEEIDLLLQKL